MTHNHRPLNPRKRDLFHLFIIALTIALIVMVGRDLHRNWQRRGMNLHNEITLQP